MKRPLLLILLCGSPILAADHLVLKDGRDLIGTYDEVNGVLEMRDPDARLHIDVRDVRSRDEVPWPEKKRKVAPVAAPAAEGPATAEAAPAALADVIAARAVAQRAREEADAARAKADEASRVASKKAYDCIQAYFNGTPDLEPIDIPRDSKPNDAAQIARVNEFMRSLAGAKKSGRPVLPNQGGDNYHTLLDYADAKHLDWLSDLISQH